MKEMMKNAGILLVITMVAGLLLGLVNEITKTPIQEQRDKAKQMALASVFCANEELGLEGAVTYEQVEFDQEKCTLLLQLDGYSKEQIDEISKAYNEAGELLGYVLLVTSKEGYAGDISFAMGVRLDGTLNGLSLTTINETQGLGMNAEKDLLPQFAYKNVPAFVYTKMGASASDEVDVISSATYTTSAIVNGVNSGLTIFRHMEEVIQ